MTQDAVPNAIRDGVGEERAGAENVTAQAPRVLIVDDDEMVRWSLDLALKRDGFETATAATVKEALVQISSGTFDVLLTDLHMPEPGDGLTVVSAMHHSNPKAATLILSAYPNMEEATAAILQQADAVLLKPLPVSLLARTVREHLTKERPAPRVVESVATILESESAATIKDWLARVDVERHILTVAMDDATRSQHLPQLFRDLTSRLRNPLPLGTRALISPAAAAHGRARRNQGYTAAMMVEESRMLQVSIFQTLQDNLYRVDFSTLLVGVMAIADEVDSQLAQAMAAYVAESKVDGVEGARADGAEVGGFAGTAARIPSVVQGGVGVARIL
jgi:DNA-binding response OmpR family regulator